MPEICDRCGEEVRIGWRHGRRDWWHRTDVDHAVRFGPPTYTPEVLAQLEAERNKIRLDDQGREYTVAEYQARRAKAASKSESADAETEEAEPVVVDIPEPEVRSTVIETTDERMPGGATRVISPARKAGWDAVATFSRGPWVHSTTNAVTGIYDFVLLRLTRGDEAAVAMWRSQNKGGWKFEHAWSWDAKTRSNLAKHDSKGLLAHLKS